MWSNFSLLSASVCFSTFVHDRSSTQQQNRIPFLLFKRKIDEKANEELYLVFFILLFNQMLSSFAHARENIFLYEQNKRNDTEQERERKMKKKKMSHC